MATSPTFYGTGRCSAILVNTANTNTDGTGGGSFPVVWTAPTTGSLIDALRIKSLVAEAGVGVVDTVRFWVSIGGTKTFLFEQVVPAVTSALGVTPAYDSGWIAVGLKLPGGALLLASTHAGQAYHVTANGGDA